MEEENKLEVGFMHCTKISVLCDPHNLVEKPWFVLQTYAVSCSLYQKFSKSWLYTLWSPGSCVLTVPLGGGVEGIECILWNSV